MGPVLKGDEGSLLNCHRDDQRRKAMLVLSRQPGETITIGRDIEVKVVGIRGGTVRLGIQAPRQVPVDRQEIHDRKVKDPGPRANEDLPHDVL